MSTEEKTDLADDIAEVYDELSEDEVEETETDDVVEDEGVEEDSFDEDVEEKTEEEVEEEAHEEEESAEEDEEGESDQEEVEVIEPLAHWKMDDKEYFKTLPEKAKTFLIERDKDFQRQATEKANQVLHITRALEPVREEMEMHGVLPEQAIATLVGAHKSLQKNPKQAIRHLMGQYGVTPEVLFSEDETQDTADPRIVALENKVTEREQAEAHAQQAAVAARIDEFSKNAEFFNDVKDEMSRLAVIERSKNPGVVPDIQKLYDDACWVNPDVRAKLQLRSQAKNEKVKSVDRSKNAAGTKVKSSAESKKVKKDTSPKTLHDDISASFDEVENRQHGTAL